MLLSPFVEKTHFLCSCRCTVFFHTCVVSPQAVLIYNCARYVLVVLGCSASETTAAGSLVFLTISITVSASSETQVKPKVEAMLLDEIQLSEALEESLGKEEIEKELDAAFEAQGGEDADLSKAFPVPEAEQLGYKEPEVQDAEMA